MSGNIWLDGNVLLKVLGRFALNASRRVSIVSNKRQLLAGSLKLKSINLTNESYCSRLNSYFNREFHQSKNLNYNLSRGKYIS